MKPIKPFKTNDDGTYVPEYHISVENEERAEELNKLGDDAFFDTFMCLAQLQGYDYFDIDNFTDWLNIVLREILNGEIEEHGGAEEFLESTKLYSLGGENHD